MSEHAIHAKEMYEAGLWSKAYLKALAKKGYITMEEYEEIVK